MATITAISPVSFLGLVLAGLLLGGPAWPALRITTQPYRGADALRGLETPPMVTEIRHLDPTMGYLKVSVLTMRTPGEVVRALIQLGRVERLILDLRGNRGGRLDAARDVAELFVPPGGLLYRERDGWGEREVRSRSPTGVWPPAMLVLIDRGTANAAEVLMGALQQAASARLVGTRSAGKGTILTADPQAGGRVRWRATGEGWLPDGTPITGRGLTPETPAGPHLQQQLRGWAPPGVRHTSGVSVEALLMTGRRWR
jgi:C-terminal processing protease CtpA/Prc